MIDDYTRLLEATAEIEDKAASDAAVTKLIMHLKSAGRVKMLPQIARELRKVAARRHALRPLVEVASRKEEEAARPAPPAGGILARPGRGDKGRVCGRGARPGGGSTWAALIGGGAAPAAASSEGIVARHASVNSSLVCGWRARQGGRLVDRSAKRALLAIYQQVTRA